VKKFSIIPDSNFSSSFGIFNPETKVIYPKYYKKSNKSCHFVVLADWAMGAVLKMFYNFATVRRGEVFFSYPAVTYAAAEHQGCLF
jgi:hypothetical protein